MGNECFKSAQNKIASKIVNWTYSGSIHFQEAFRILFLYKFYKLEKKITALRSLRNISSVFLKLNGF